VVKPPALSPLKLFVRVGEVFCPTRH